MRYELVGLGNALLDFQIQVPDSVLHDLKVTKASMTLVESAYQLQILSELHQRFGREKFDICSGGSSANTVAGFVNYGGSGFYIGKVGRDENGQDYEKDLLRQKIGFCVRNHEDMPTGTCLALITPDAERTMLTHLGSAIDLSVKDLPVETIQQAEIIYLEGYLWDSRTAQEACREAAHMARSKGVKVAMTFSDSFCVNRHKDDFLQMARSQVDILFCNAAEAQAATGKPDVFSAFKDLSRVCPIVAVSNGAHGALLSENFGEKTEAIETWDVNVVDKLGAGDLFASGVLFGLVRKRSLREAGFLGCYSATKVIQQMGARLRESMASEVNEVSQGPESALQASRSV